MTTQRLFPDEVPPPDQGPKRSRGRRHRGISRHRRFRRRLFVAVGILAAVIGTAYVTSAPRARLISAVQEYTQLEVAPPPVAQVPLSRTRAMYRHSVIPGGAYTRDELVVALDTDPVAREHYGDFDVARARVIRVDTPRAVHVSYRLGDKVYWTRAKVWLRPGEALLTDGVQQSRSRCGNRVAEEVAGPVAPEEPPIETLDEEIPAEPPGIPPLQAYALMFFETPHVAPQPVALLDPLPANPVTILPPPPVLVTETTPTPPPPPVGPVPEPATLTLLGTGAALLAARRLRRRKL